LLFSRCVIGSLQATLRLFLAVNTEHGRLVFVVHYSRCCTKRVLDHFQHAHFFKMADISDGPVLKLKLRRLLFLVTKS